MTVIKMYCLPLITSMQKNVTTPCPISEEAPTPPVVIMGKSMRSKRKQKLKRERKEKFKVKELKSLKDMLRAAGENVDGHSEAVMVDADERKSS